MGDKTWINKTWINKTWTDKTRIVFYLTFSQNDHFCLPCLKYFV